MKALLAVILGIAIAGAAYWWQSGHPGYETPQQERERMAKQKEAARPKLYRWRDANGSLQLTNEPPSGRRYEILYMDEERNAVIDGSLEAKDVVDTPENRP
jgi:hypothetical protein